MQNQSAAGAVKVQEEGLDAMLVRHMMQAMRLGGESGVYIRLSVSPHCQLLSDFIARKSIWQHQNTPYKVRFSEFVDDAQRKRRKNRKHHFFVGDDIGF